MSSVRRVKLAGRMPKGFLGGFASRQKPAPKATAKAEWSMGKLGSHAGSYGLCLVGVVYWHRAKKRYPKKQGRHPYPAELARHVADGAAWRNGLDGRAGVA